MVKKRNYAAPVSSRVLLNGNRGLVVTGSGNVLHIYLDRDGVKGQSVKTVVTENVSEMNFPEVLQTDKAMALLAKFQKAGKLDEHFHPLGLSRAYKALLAYALADELKLKNKWSVFEHFWNINALLSAYTKAMKQDNMVTITREIEDIIKA